MGLYQRPDSDVYWISYRDGNNRRVRESTNTSDKEISPMTSAVQAGDS